jgi:uncharacterized membrane protein
MLDWVAWFKDIPVELATIIVAMTPISELRGSIPLALGVWKIAPWTAFFLSVLGNMIPVIFILLLIGPVSQFLGSHSKFFKSFFDWIFKKTKRDHAEKVSKWGVLALFILVAIPLPFTGAWTGSLVAFVFQIPFKQSFPAIFGGVVVAGLIVTFLGWSIFI